MNLTGNGNHRNNGSGIAIDKAAFEQEAQARATVQMRIEELVHADEPLSLNDIFKPASIQKLHKELFDGIIDNAGAFREGDIHVGFHVPSARGHDSILAWLNDYEKDCIKRLKMVLNGTDESLLLGFAFWKLTYIAPFEDGNGRVAQAHNMIVQRGLGLKPEPIYNKSAEGDYHKLKHELRDWDGGNATPFLQRLEKKWS